MLHYHLQVQANPQKMAQKKTMLFLASMGKTGLTHDIFFKFSVVPFRVVEAEGGHQVKEANFGVKANFTLFFATLCFTANFEETHAC